MSLSEVRKIRLDIFFAADSGFSIKIPLINTLYLQDRSDESDCMILDIPKTPPAMIDITDDTVQLLEITKIKVFFMCT